MIQRFALLLLLLPYFALLGCSDGNSGAPLNDRSPHPLDWIKVHPASALAAADFADCTLCHGNDLKGNGEAVSCYSCHAFNPAPLTFVVHPEAWGDNVYVNHRSFANANGFSTCTKCHGSDLHGSPAAPSCFSSSFNSQGCHAEGPSVAPHPVDGSFLDPSNHGPAAKGLTAAFPNGMADCQSCHGQPGGPGSNPRFNRGIRSVNNTGCEGCHGPNLAHPANWAGPNKTFHYSVSKDIIQKACTLCHGVNLRGTEEGGVGVSCMNCHAETTDFTLDCTKCHGYPPDGTADVATDTGVPHGIVAFIPQHDTCVICHGMKESSTGGSFSTTPNYLLFDKSSNTLGDHWNGKIDMNSSPGYDQTTFGCTGACHANDAGHQLSDSGLPVELKNFGFDSAVPHSTDVSFVFPQNHGPAAKGLTAAFPNGMVDCQPCHAQPGVNPRFNVGISGNGCEQCHNDGTAHPSVGGRDNQRWYDGPYTHSTVPATKLTTMCTLCHGANLEGGSGPSCTHCHRVNPVDYPTGCVSCHNNPPDSGPPVGDQHPNRAGQHWHTSLINADPNQTCNWCHKGATAGTSAHLFNTGIWALVSFDLPDPSDNMVATSTALNTTCTGTCHATYGTHTHSGTAWY